MFSKFARGTGKKEEQRTAVPKVAQTTYALEGNQWYTPLLAGPATFIPATVGGAVTRQVLAVLERLTPDRYLEFVAAFCRTGLERFGDNWVYADINTVLLGLSRSLQPSNYLEIGVRRGRSMAMVASQAPHCSLAGFDLWQQDYAGMENPGPDFVRDEMARIGHVGQIEFVGGDSRQTVPNYFKRNPDIFFDLVTVDGDHSLEGAKTDLVNVMPRIKVGGALVFDDVSHQDHPGLREVWEETVRANRAYESYLFGEVGFGVAFAIRKW
jgi:predicted O-methyltransferase YrrM